MNIKSQPGFAICAIAATALLALQPCPASAQQRSAGMQHAPSTALLKPDNPADWAAGLRYERENRQLMIAGDVQDLEADRLGVFISYAPLPWTVLSIGAGAAAADIDAHKGEFGIEWQAGARVGIIEHALAQSPVRGKTQLLRLDGLLEYRQAQSHYSGDDFRWQEWRFTPTVTYSKALTPHLGYRLLHPDAAALQAGMVFSNVRGRLAGNSLGENRDFGLRLGGAVRVVEGWAVFADGIAFHASEISVAAGLRRGF